MESNTSTNEIASKNCIVFFLHKLCLIERPNLQGDQIAVSPFDLAASSSRALKLELSNSVQFPLKAAE